MLVKKKVLIIAFGNPDNVLSYAYHLSEKAETEVVYVISGDRFRQGILDIDLSGNVCGLTKDAVPDTELKEYISGKFKLHLLKTPSRKIFPKSGWLKNLKIIKDFSKSINKENYDVIHFNGTSGFLFYFLRYIKHKNKFWTLHDYKSHLGEENRKGDFINKLVAKYSDMKIIQHYEYLRKEFIKYYKIPEDRVKQLYSGVFDIYNGFKEKEIAEVTNKEYVLFTGRISKYKGIDFLIKAFEKYQGDVNLVIAGSGEINEMTNDKRIFVINRHLSAGEMKYLVRHSKCVILPYIESTHSGVAMTALALGKRVLASDIDGLKEVINEKTGKTFTKKDENDFLKKLYDMLKESNNEVNIDDKINWDNITNKAIEYYFGK